MTRLEWWTAGVVAACVAAITVTVTAPPVCWAEQTALAAIPALPPTQLTIPAIGARVSAETSPMPGQGVRVLLMMTSSAAAGLLQVPVTITVSRTVMDPFAREMPAPKRVARVDAAVPVGLDGNGSTVVELPLIWAAPEPPPAVDPAEGKDAKQARLLRTMISYQMALSSPLGGQAAPSELPSLDNYQGAKDATPTPPPLPIPRNSVSSTDLIGALLGLDGRGYIASALPYSPLARWNATGAPIYAQAARPPRAVSL